MSSQVSKEITVIRNVILFVILPFIVYGVVLGKISEQIREKESSVQLDMLRLQKYYRDGFSSPTQERIDAQKQSCQQAKDLLDSISSYCYSPVIEIPDTVDDTRVFFKEQLYLAQKDLQTAAEQAKVSIPESLGFSEDMPAEEAVADKLLQLSLVKSILQLSIDTGVAEISSVKFMDVADVVNAQEEKLPYRNISVALTMACSQESLREILYELGGMNPYVVVTGLTVTNTSSGKLEAQIVVMQLRSSAGGVA